MPLLTRLLLLIVSARLLGRLSVRLGQPAIVGEMMAGVLLGPAALGLVHLSPELSGITELAVFLVVLSAGLEMNFKDVASAFRGRGLVIALLSFFVPLIAGMATGWAFQLDAMRTVFLGLAMSITALPVAVRILSSFNLLHSRIASYSIASAILNDLAALFILGVILDLPEQGTLQAVGFSVLETGSKLALFAGVVLGFNAVMGLLKARGVRISAAPERLVQIFGPEALLGIVVAFVLVFSSMSEALGFHFVIGAFFGALLIDKGFFLASRYEELEKTLASITGGFLAPIFFAQLGLEFKVSAMHSAAFVAAVLAVSIASKLAAGWVGGRWIGLPRAEALGIGIILNGRGVMELVIASIAYQRGFIGQGLFSTLVLMGVATTVITPVIFRKWVVPGLGEKS